MKKIFLLIMIFISAKVFGQFPSEQSMASPKTQVYSKGSFGSDSGFIYRSCFTDTIQANRGFIKNIPGIKIRTCDDNEWMRNNTAMRWVSSPTDTSNKWVNRLENSLGSDSIYYYIGNTRYAIADNGGGGGGANNYPIAFTQNYVGGFVLSLQRNGLSDITTTLISGAPTIGDFPYYNGSALAFNSGLRTITGGYIVYNGDTLSSRLYARSILSGSTNSNIGSGYRLTVPFTNNVKTLFPGFNMLLDSSSNINGLTFTPDTTTGLTKLATQGDIDRAVIAAGAGTVTDVSRTNGYGITASVANPNTTPNITIAVDSATLSTKYMRFADSTNMLSKYFNLRGYGVAGTGKTIIADTSTNALNLATQGDITRATAIHNLQAVTDIDSVTTHDIVVNGLRVGRGKGNVSNNNVLGSGGAGSNLNKDTSQMNVIIGDGAAANATGMRESVAIGSYAANSFTTSGNLIENGLFVAIGASAASLTRSNSFVAIGQKSLLNNINGSNTVSIGVHNLDGVKYANRTVSIGNSSGGSGGSTDSTDELVLIGYRVSAGVGKKTQSVVIGNGANENGLNLWGSTYIGFSSGGNGGPSTHNDTANSGVGMYSLNSTRTGAGYNTAFGYGSLVNLTTGRHNRKFGSDSLLSNGNITTGNNNTVIGDDIQIQSGIASHQLNIMNGVFGTGLSGTGTTKLGKIGILNGTPDSVFDVTGSGRFSTNLRVDNWLAVGTSAPMAQMELYGAGQTTANLTDAGVRTGTLAINSSGNSANNGGAIVFGNSNSKTTGSLGFAAIKALLTNGSSNTTGDLAFSTRNSAGATSLTERMRIESGGNVTIGTTVSNGYKLNVLGTMKLGNGAGWDGSLDMSDTLTIDAGVAGSSNITARSNSIAGAASISLKNTALNGRDWRILVGGDSSGGSGGLSPTEGNFLIQDVNAGTNAFILMKNSGNVGIRMGTDLPDSSLTVLGGIRAKRLKLDSAATTPQAFVLMANAAGTVFKVDTTLALGGGGSGSFYDSTLMASVKRLKDTAAAIRSTIAGGGGGTVTSVSGTTNKITSTGGTTPVINIGGDVVDETVSNTFVAGTKQSFTGNSTTPPINIVPVAGNPSAGTNNGDIWWNSSSGTMRTWSSSIREFTWNDATQTLSNKTLTSPLLNVGSDATGDLYYRNGSAILTRLGIGTTKQTMHVVSGVPAWRDTVTLDFDSIGTYTPTLFNTTNVTTSTAYPTMWQTQGGGIRITVTGQVLVDPTSTGAVVLGIEIPFATSLAQNYSLNGVAVSEITGEPAYITADTTNNRALLQFTATSTASRTYKITFTYDYAPS